MSRKFRYDGREVTATYMGPDVEVMATAIDGKVPQSIRDVIQFEDQDGNLRTVPLPRGQFDNLSEMALVEIYKEAITEV